MKKVLIALFFCLVASAVSGLDSISRVSPLLRFHAELQDIAKPGARVDPELLYLVEGMVTAIQVKEDSESAFRVELEFMSASYQDDDSLLSYKITLVLSGAQFRQIVVTKPGRPLGPGQIGVSSRGLALVQLIPGQTVGSAKNLTAFTAHDFRVLK